MKKLQFVLMLVFLGLFPCSGISDEILLTNNMLFTFGDLKAQGFKDVIVQPTHLFHMERYHIEMDKP
ncbi:MAG: hypothetical protein ABIJ59_08180 [Pseudomonadota bacterium]